MKQTISQYHQIINALSMIILITVANFFDGWQDQLKVNAGATLESQYISMRLWSVPMAALLFTLCWLALFLFMNKHKNKGIATLFLIVGIFILFYPSIATTLGISSTLGISVNYFGDTMLFYSSALMAAIGLINILISIERNRQGRE